MKRLMAASVATSLLMLVPACRHRSLSAEWPLRILLGSNVLSLDPQASWDDVAWAVLGNAFEGLVQFDPSLHIVPRLALRWINPDDKTWRFVLDPGTRFHDGQPLEAADVVYSIERVRTLPGSDLKLFATPVQSAVAIDTHTVEIKSAFPGALLSSLAFIPIMSRRSGDHQFGPDVLPVGTGPYRIVGFEPNRSIRLEAHPHRPPLRIRAADFLLTEMPLTYQAIVDATLESPSS